MSIEKTKAYCYCALAAYLHPVVLVTIWFGEFSHFDLMKASTFWDVLTISLISDCHVMSCQYTFYIWCREYVIYVDGWEQMDRERRLPRTRVLQAVIFSSFICVIEYHLVSHFLWTLYHWTWSSNKLILRWIYPSMPGLHCGDQTIIPCMFDCLYEPWSSDSPLL